MVRVVIFSTSHKIEVEKVYSSPEINMTLWDNGDGEVCVGLSVEEAQSIMASLQREIKEHADFYERIRQEALRRSCQQSAPNANTEVEE